MVFGQLNDVLVELLILPLHLLDSLFLVVELYFAMLAQFLLIEWLLGHLL